MSSPPRRAVVVGAGPNGLAAAIVLAQEGLQVEVFEAEPHAGGGARTLPLTLPGFMHDFGSAVHPMALASPFFGSRWRWDASRALALLRFRHGRKVPINLLRMQSDDLLASVERDRLAHGHLRKPFEIDALLALVKPLL